MKSTDYLNQYKSNGFVKLKNIFSDKDIEKILTELDEVKKILIKIKKKKIYHKTKDGRTVKKGLYYYMNKAKKSGKSRPGKGTVTDKALKRSAKTAKKA